MLTKQSVVKSSNDNCIIASISSLVENSSLNASSIMLSKNDIDNMKTVGIEEFYVYIDFKIGYSINKTDIYYDNLNNYKTTINKK